MSGNNQSCFACNLFFRNLNRKLWLILLEIGEFGFLFGNDDEWVSREYPDSSVSEEFF